MLSFCCHLCEEFVGVYASAEDESVPPWLFAVFRAVFHRCILLTLFCHSDFNFGYKRPEKRINFASDIHSRVFKSSASGYPVGVSPLGHAEGFCLGGVGLWGQGVDDSAGEAERFS